MKTTDTDLMSDVNLGSGASEPDQDRQSGSDSRLEREFLGRVWTFKGRELWPYTEGGDILCRQLAHPEDNGLTRALKFVFVHIKRGGETMKDDVRRHVIPLAWQSADAIHADLFDWISDNVKNDADKLEAIKLRDEILAAATAAQIEVVPEVGQKKTTAKRRVKPRS